MSRCHDIIVQGGTKRFPARKKKLFEANEDCDTYGNKHNKYPREHRIWVYIKRSMQLVTVEAFEIISAMLWLLC